MQSADFEEDLYKKWFRRPTLFMACAWFLLAVAGRIVIRVGLSELALLMKRLGGLIPCPIRKLTGLNCPGCGNTRAFAALMQGRFMDSLRLNYAYPAQYAYLFAVYLRGAKSYVRRGRVSLNPKHPVPEYVFLGLLLAWGVVRNIIGV